MTKAKVTRVRKKKQEPKKFYIMTDEYTSEYEVTETPESLEKLMIERLADDPESFGNMQVFEAIELDFEVESRPRVTIHGKSS